MKIPTVSVFNQIPLAVCACQRMCLKTHKPQTKQRLLKTRAVPELITNITLFGPTKPSLTPSQTPFLCTCVQVTSSTCIESCPVLRNSSCRVVAADGMTLLFIVKRPKASPCKSVWCRFRAFRAKYILDLVKIRFIYICLNKSIDF